MANIKKLPIAAHLSDGEYRLLLQVYANHNRSMGLKERSKYTLTDITKVVKNAKDKCLDVYYGNGNWWHYYTNGTWS